MYELIIVPEKFIMNQLLQERDKIPDDIIVTTYEPYISFFRPFSEEELASIQMLLYGWGNFQLIINTAPRIVQRKDVDDILYPVDSHDLYHIQNILSRFLDTIPLYNEYKVVCHLCSVHKNKAVQLLDPRYQQLVSRVKEISILLNTEIIDTIILNPKTQTTQQQRFATFSALR